MSSVANLSKKKSSSTGSSKKAGITNPVVRRTSGSRVVADHFSQTRIKELEQQVSDLKRRLDELRKAKSTTVIKRDKEYVTTGVSHGAHDGAVKGADDPDCHKQETKSAETGLDQRVQTSNQEVKKLEDSITAMKELHRKEIEELKTEVEKQCSQQAKQADSSMAAELERIKNQNREFQQENEELKSKTAELQLRVEELLEELSKKEAEWCTKEEKLLLEVKASWGEKYQKWMAQTEQKIEELQTANNFLKMLLEKERPDRS